MTTLGGGTGSESTFSRIIAGELPAQWESNDPALPVVCFRNRLKWERVMLLVVPRDYMTQEELWTGDVLVDALRLAVEMGEKHCPEGFRVLSNFGRAAHQSQLHAHIHVISGVAAAITAAAAEGEWQQEGPVRVRHQRVKDVPHADLYSDDLAASQYEFLTGEGALLTAQAAVKHGKSLSVGGFRLAANYVTEGDQRGGAPGLFLLGGGQLQLYV
jgi:diadenosine tetraphosphate (Ap4A) HIT family hydrolase